MKEPASQNAKTIVMVRPHEFRPNPQTASDNPFQKTAPADLKQLARDARDEFAGALGVLRQAGVEVHVFEDRAQPATPDAVFPNNWFSTHPDGQIVLYPMRSPARRQERRGDIISRLIEDYHVDEVIDLSHYEREGRFLEGTGSLVFDHRHKAAYLAISARSDPGIAEELCTRLGVKAVIFRGSDPSGGAIYHTNVLMCIGTGIALIGLDLIADADERERIRMRLAETGRTVIGLSADQVSDFAGNAIELANAKGEPLLVMSERAARSLNAGQRAAIERCAAIVSFPLGTIELSGGSARCMIASIHLPPRTEEKRHSI